MSQSPSLDRAKASAEAPSQDDAPSPLADGAATPGPLPRWVALPLAVAGGIAVWLAFPDRNLWWAAPFGLAAWALAVRGRRARPAAGMGLLFAFSMFLPLLHWSGIYVGRLPWFAFAFTLSLYVSAASAAMSSVWRLAALRGGAAWVVIGGTGLWVAQEALVTRWPFGGFGWSRLAFSQTDAPSLGLASLGGAPLVSAAVAAAGLCLAVAVTRLSTGRRVVTVAAVIAALAISFAGAVVPRPDAAEVGTARIAAVQGNVPRAGLDFNAQRRAVLDNHVKATMALAERVRSGAEPAPVAVLWPENSSDIDPLRNPDAATEIQRAADAINAPVVVGAVLAPGQRTLSNTLIVWGPTSGRGAPAGPGQQYSKVHPAPFAEYVPFRSFFRHFNENVDRVTAEFIPGTARPQLTAGGVRLGPAICFEVAFDDLVRNAVQDGADLLYIPTNNATFGYSDESVQQLGISRLRAVESGRAVVHVSTVGVSGLIAPDGTVLDRSGHFTQQVLSADLPLRTSLTVATRVGIWPEMFCVALGMMSLLAGFVLGKKRVVSREVGK